MAPQVSLLHKVEDRGGARYAEAVFASSAPGGGRRKPYPLETAAAGEFTSAYFAEVDKLFRDAG
eukprot:11276798-Alexandrium_andersonii.AAC.1